ncbi:Fic family protein [Candidatus Woesearchaeota archaeon]|nr:Fic family protein [Candidatus Woesearchaeota archaeon]
MLEAILEQIDTKLNRVKTHPEFSKKHYYTVVKTLQEESFRHSWDMESSDAVGGWQLLQNAWKYLLGNGVSLGSLSTLGNKVEPTTTENFRSKMVAFGGFYPDEPSKVIYHMNDLVDFYKHENNFHPIQKAIELHNQLVEIHPYDDGNGRVARLLSNYFLVENDFLPYVIERDERPEYISLLKDVMKSRFNEKSNIYNPSIAESAFYYYIAEKVLDSVVHVEDELNKRRMYEISFTKTSDSKALVRRVSNSIGKCKQVGPKVSLSHAHKSIDVIGDVSLDELRYCVDWYKENRSIDNFKYKIKVKF